MFRKLCGETTLKNVVLVTNMWSEVTPEVGKSREKELSSRFFKPALDKHAQMVRHHNTTKSAHDIVRKIMKNKPAVLQIQQELVDEHKDIVHTAAGETINKELNAEIRRHQAELKKVQEEMMQAMAEKDERTRRELEEERKKLQERVDRIKKDSEGMAAGYIAEKRRMEAELEEIERRVKKETEKVETEHRRRVADIQRRLQDTVDASAADRAKWEQELERLQDRFGIPIYK